MINPFVEKQILAQLNKLSNEQQKQVLDFAQFLATKNPIGVPRRNLLQFAGTISDEDAKIMLEAVQEDWEQNSSNH